MTLLAPHTEVHAMIAQTFQDAFSPQWIKTHLTNPTHDLILLRHIIPWHPILDRLVPFYNPQKGRPGHSLRLLVATSILSRLRQLSDRKVIEEIQENRYMQYFCNVPDQSLITHIPHPSDGDPHIFPGAFFPRTAHPNSVMLSSHERRYTKRLRLRSVVWGSFYRPSKCTRSNICPL